MDDKTSDPQAVNPTGNVAFADDTPSEEPKQTEVVTLLQVESAIKTRIAQMDRIREEAKPHKEMLDTFLNNDEAFLALSEEAKEVNKKKSSRKKELLKTPNGQQLLDKINQLKDQLKEYQESLSYFLREYQRLTGANEIEGDDGELRQIVYMAKLVRKTNLNRD